MVVDGTGGPAYGPAHVVIRDDRIIRVFERHTSLAGLDGSGYEPAMPDEVASADRFDLPGWWVLPGFIDSHAHVGAPDQVESREYVYKLWLGHGITRIREMGSLGVDFDTMLAAADASRTGQLLAPIIHPYLAFGTGAAQPITTPDQARAWVARTRKRGAAGVKFFGAAPDLMKAALTEARKQGLGTACHHSQQTTPRANARQNAQWGLGSIEHLYGLPESMYRDRLLPAVPPDFNYSDERMRFAEAGRLWTQGARPSEAAWTDFLDELVQLDTTLVPTYTVYSATRDVERARNREWVSAYLSPRLSRFFTPCGHRHGSFFADWGTEQESAWKATYALWMRFVRDFTLRGGRVAVGSDPGFIHSLYGFSYIDELELMRETGLQPLEIIRAATLSGAELLGIGGHTGSIVPGKQADLLLVGENPLANLKVLYGHGYPRTDEAGVTRRSGGIDVTVIGGRPVDSRAMLADVRDMVAALASDSAHAPAAVPGTPD
jgi:cytosine/adenosine deaminase-related metal-dependent hydrolase